MDYTAVEKLVLETKKIIMSKTSLKVSVKAKNDFVTDVDLAISGFLKEKLREIDPSVGFLSEEEKGSLSDNCWILDPIDGTTNLIYGYNLSSVSLGHYYNGQIIYGIVYNPFTEEIFTAENLALVKGTKDFGDYDAETQTQFRTRLILPVFEASTDVDLVKTLQALGIRDLFSPVRCDNSALLDSSLQAYCNEVRHIAKLKVDRRGVEGAAVTVMGEAGAAPSDNVVYADFAVDRAFGFLLTDPYGNILFAGVVRSL